MTKKRKQKETITLLVAHDGRLAAANKTNFVTGADEVIEVSTIGKPLLQHAASDRTRFRYIKQHEEGVAHAINLGVSFASSEWVVVSFGDEVVAQDWLNKLRSFLIEPESKCIHLFYSENSPGMPLIVARRDAFVYGPFDERFVCGRFSALHWVFRIFPRRAPRILSNEGLNIHDCDFIEGQPCPSVKAPLICLMELWHDLEPHLRCMLLKKATSDPAGTRKSLLALLKTNENIAKTKVDPCRDGSYEAKSFWESNPTGYIRWEVYQPDEPEIIALLGKINFHSVLELGCGAGRNTRYFVSARRYSGVDISCSLLQRAVERQEPNSIGTLCADISELPYADASFDLLFSDSTVQHVTPNRIYQCVEELVRTSAKYICLIEYTEEDCEDGEWFSQIHMFAHDYRRLFEPYCDLVWHAETSLRVHPARKEVFLFKKRQNG